MTVFTLGYKSTTIF